MMLRLFGGGERKIPFHSWQWKIASAPTTAGVPDGADQAQAKLENFLRYRLRLDAEADIKFVGSGRTAIRLGLVALGQLEPNKQSVIVPSYCCSAVVDAIVGARLKPRFIDTSESLVSRASQYREAVTNDTLAAIVVNLCGKRLPQGEHSELLAELKKIGVFSLEDNCQDLFGQPPGLRADMECYSFGFAKTLNSTAGGALVARLAHEEIEDEFRTHQDQPAGHAKIRFDYYRARFRDGEASDSLINDFRGSRSEFGQVRMSEMDTCIAASQIDTVTEAVQRSTENSLQLISTMQEFPSIYRHQGLKDNTFTRLPVILPTSDIQSKFWSFFNAHGIELEGMYKPLHLAASAEAASETLPVTDSIWRRVFNIPNRADLGRRDLNHIDRTLRSFARETL